jgi:7-cyano-7-deazaguanine synthase in queuosine biosynthesis
MTDDAYPTDAKTHPDDHQHTTEACEHALNALHDGDLTHARSFLDEARAAVERAQHDDSRMQEQRETAWDCYE